MITRILVVSTWIGFYATITGAAVVKRQVFPGLNGVTSAASGGIQIQRAQTTIKGGFDVPAGVDDEGNPVFSRVGGDFRTGKSPVGFQHDHLFGRTGDDGGPKTAFGGLDTEIFTGRKNQIAGNIGFPVGKDSKGRPIQSGFGGDLETGKGDPRIKYGHSLNRDQFGGAPTQQQQPTFGPGGGRGSGPPMLFGPASGQWGSSGGAPRATGPAPGAVPQGRTVPPQNGVPPSSGNVEYRYPPGCDPNDPSTVEACRPPPGTDPRVIYVYPVSESVFDKMMRESASGNGNGVNNQDPIIHSSSDDVTPTPTDVSTIEPLVDMPGVETRILTKVSTPKKTRKRKTTTRAPTTTVETTEATETTEITETETPEAETTEVPFVSILRVGKGTMIDADERANLGS